MLGIKGYVEEALIFQATSVLVVGPMNGLEWGLTAAWRQYGMIFQSESWAKLSSARENYLIKVASGLCSPITNTSSTLY